MREYELVRRLQEKEEEAFEEIVRLYTAFVMTVIRQIIVPPLSEEDVEELAADTFARLWQKSDTIRNPAAIKAYLAQLARNAARRRRQQYKVTVPLTEDELVCFEQQPETISSLREQTSIIVDALNNMERVRRDCLIRRYYYGEPLALIASHLSLPLSTVKSHVYRGRQQLLKALKERGYAYEANDIAADLV